MKVVGFDWDDGNLAKCQKHGVGIGDIEALLLTSEQVSPDLRHSFVEQRLVAVGTNSAGRPIFVGFTLRQIDGQTLLRPITARYMHAKEAKNYGTGKAPASPADDQ